MDTQLVEMSEAAGTVGPTEDVAEDEQETSASGDRNGDGTDGMTENDASPQGADSATNNENEQSQTPGARSIENPPAKKIKIGKEAEHLLTALPEKEKESIALLKTPSELIASFRFGTLHLLISISMFEGFV